MVTGAHTAQNGAGLIWAVHPCYRGHSTVARPSPARSRPLVMDTQAHFSENLAS